MTTHPAHIDTPSPARPTKARYGLLLFSYGMIAYTVGVIGLLALIASTFGLVTFTGGPLHIQSTAGAIAFNFGLISLFGIQHTIMAGQAFKNWWSRVFPKPIERVSFTLVTGLLVLAILWLWQPLPQVMWAVESPILTIALYSLGALGWTYLFLASFAIDHFELFGLRQVWRNLRGKEADNPNFKMRWMYAFDRHPIMSGVLIGMWCVPIMHLSNLVMAAAFTFYIFVGVSIEELRLYKKHGQSYKDYRASVRSLVPRFLRWA
jgi:methanethiol S-methyltransferase